MCIACSVMEKYGGQGGELLLFHMLRVRLGIFLILSNFTGTMQEAKETMEDRDIMELAIKEFWKVSPYTN